ncbi:MAG: SAM-dependent methyltransferase, partial [Trebonia sp.]
MTAPAGRRPGAAGTIAWAASQAGVVLPVRVRAWDGSDAGPPAAPTVVLRSPLALRRILWRPGELGLARAYISGDLDVEGDLTEGLRSVRRALPGRRPGWRPARW